MAKPAIHFQHPASAHDWLDERTILVVFQSGRGCLVSLRTYGDKDIIDVYRADDGIFVMRPDKSDPYLIKEQTHE